MRWTRTMEVVVVWAVAGAIVLPAQNPGSEPTPETSAPETSVLPSLPNPTPPAPPFPDEGTRSRKNDHDTKKQAAPPPEGSEFKIRSDVELVLLDVAVKDRLGGFVSGLKKEDFKVLESKVPQDISIFQAQDVPVTVGLVVDNSGSVRPKKPEIVTAALTLVKHSNPHDEVFVLNFNDRIVKGLPEGVDFTDDHAKLRDALVVNPAQGRTALYDGLRMALDHIEKGRLDKKTLVLISDGGDNASDTTRDEIVRLVQESLTTIYTVGIFNPHDKDKNPGFLKQLAEVSGGEYFAPQTLQHLSGVCEKIAKDIRNRYTLGYSPKNLTFDGKVRKLRVLALHPESGKTLEVRTRTQYIAAEGRQD
jgi:Ca-activated chloride channel homolog